MPRSSAVFALMYATLSHVTFESGFGSSCSHALLAKRPSSTFGSGRKMISMPVFCAPGRLTRPSRPARPAPSRRPRIDVPGDEAVVQRVLPERLDARERLAIARAEARALRGQRAGPELLDQRPSAARPGAPFSADMTSSAVRPS